MIDFPRLIQNLLDEGASRKIIAVVVSAFRNTETAVDKQEDLRRRDRERKRASYSPKTSAEISAETSTLSPRNLPGISAEISAESPSKTERSPTPPKEKTNLLSVSNLTEINQLEEVVTDGQKADLTSKFNEFWAAYPKRDGSNPKTPALKKFTAAVKSGVDPDVIIDGARRYSAEAARQSHVGTPYVAQAMTWLNQKRWGDYANAPISQDDPRARGWRPGMITDEEIREQIKQARIADDGRQERRQLQQEGSGSRSDEHQLVRGETRNRRSEGMGEIFSNDGLDAHIFQINAGGQGSDIHGAGSVASMVRSFCSDDDA